jgi:hypothetical protein
MRLQADNPKPAIQRVPVLSFSFRGCWLLGAWALFAPGWAAQAADVETRDFAVLVDGKHAGEAHMTIHRKDDSVTEFACDTDVKVKFLWVTYRYSYRGREVWKNGRLVSFASATNDDGKRFQVTATAQEDGLHVRVNGRERVVSADVWLTSYWTLPEAKRRDEAIPLIDADTGKELECRIRKIGEVQVPVAGELQNATHYQFTGKVAVDAWYDGGERLVRQEWIEDGHRTLLELVRIRR